MNKIIKIKVDKLIKMYNTHPLIEEINILSIFYHEKDNEPGYAWGQKLNSDGELLPWQSWYPEDSILQHLKTRLKILNYKDTKTMLGEVETRERY